MAGQPLRQEEERLEPRDEVFHRTRALLPDRRCVTILVVNLSPGGLMARVEATIAAGERLTVDLPGLGPVGAAVRWSLGGRIGCRFDRPIGPLGYGRLLAAMTA